MSIKFQKLNFQGIVHQEFVAKWQEVILPLRG